MILISVLCGILSLFETTLPWNPDYGSETLVGQPDSAANPQNLLQNARNSFLRGTRIPPDVQKALLFELFDPRNGEYQAILSYEGFTRRRLVHRCANGLFDSSKGDHLGARELPWFMPGEKVWTASDEAGQGPLFARLSVFADGRSKQLFTFVPEANRDTAISTNWTSFVQLANRLRVFLRRSCDSETPEPVDGEERIGLHCQLNGKSVACAPRVQFWFNDHQVISSPVIRNGFVMPIRARSEAVALEVEIGGSIISFERSAFGSYEGALLIERNTSFVKSDDNQADSFSKKCIRKGGEVWVLRTEPADGDGIVHTSCVQKKKPKK